MARRRTGLVVPVTVAFGGLAVLVAAQLTLVRDEVEQDLTTRSTGALHRAGITGIDVSVVGRDVRLTGTARTGDEAVEAVRVVKAERGVRVVIAAFDRPTAGTPRSPHTRLPTPTPAATTQPATLPTTQPASQPATLPTSQPATQPTSTQPPATPTAPATPSATTTATATTPAATPTATTPTPTPKKPPAPEDETARVRRQLAALPEIRFRSRMSTLPPASRASVLQAARILRANPGVRVQVAGYTDDVGSSRINRELSAGRAEVVRLTLIHFGVSPDRLQLAWFGETHPLVPNTSAANRARNRRVALVVLP